MLRRTFPKAAYRLLEDPDELARIRSDPRGWLEDLATPAIVDEIQNAPELIPYIRARIDAAKGRRVMYLLTGSQDFTLMSDVSESLAGRAAIFSLLPLSWRELGSWDLVRGSYPEVVGRPRARALWLRSYVQTYLERDVRAVAAVRDLSVFRRFLSLVAARTGQVLNRSDIAAPLGVSVPTIAHWLSVLETTGVLLVVPPYFESFDKRLIKSPKLYFVDSGLACHLLGLESRLALERSPFLGPLFEGFVASEIVKNQLNRGEARALFHFRDQQGLEVDFVLPPRDTRPLTFVEVKWTRTVTPEMATPMRRLMATTKAESTRGIIVHRAARGEPSSLSVAPGVRAFGVESFLRSDV